MCAAAVGILAWRARVKADESASSRAGRRDGEVASEVYHASETAPPETRAAVQGTPESVSARRQVDAGDSRAPVAASGSPKVVVGRPMPDKVYRPAEATSDPERGALRVIVKPAAGLPPGKAQVLVTVKSNGRYQTTRHRVGPDGCVEVNALEPGRGTVGAMLSGRHRRASVEIQAGRFIEVEIGFGAGVTVKGTVRHVVRGPLPDLSLELRRKDGAFEETIRARTDAQGEYRFESVPPGTYPVIVSGKFIGYEQRPRGTLVVSGSVPLTRDLVLGRVNLRGVVREAGTGKSLPGVGVRLGRDRGYAKTTTDAEGAYAFSDLAEGECRLSLNKEGYGQQFLETGPVPAEGVRTLDCELVPAAVLVLEVRDREGDPVPGRHHLGLHPVESETSVGSQIVVDAKGLGRNARIVPGTYVLTLRADGFFSHSERIEIKPGENHLSMRLDRTEETRRLSLQGTLRDSVTGRPVPGVSVRIQRPRHFEALTDENGTYRLHDVPPGPCVLILSRDGYGIRVVRDVEVGAEVRALDFQLAPAATLHVYATDSANRPVVGRIFLGINGLGAKTTRIGTGIEADAEGHAIFRKIVPGPYELRIRCSGVGEAKVNVEITPGENTLRVRLE